MADTTQNFIDSLILTIQNAEDPESVTNEMVAAVFDFLNKGYKNLLTNNSAVATEKAERQAADAALQRTIDTVQLAIAAVRNTANAADAKSKSNEAAINTLLGKNATAAIESFNEVIAFLSGIKDNESLVSLLDAIRQRLDDFDREVERLNSIDESHDDRISVVEELNTAIHVVDTLDLDTTTDTGIYYYNPATVLMGSTRNILIVKSMPGQRLAGGGSR